MPQEKNRDPADVALDRRIKGICRDVEFPDHSAERNTNATFLAPHDVAGIDFFGRHNDQCELVGDIALRSDVERGSFVGQITNNAADRHFAEPDQSHVHNAPATRFSRFRWVDYRHPRFDLDPTHSVHAAGKMVNTALMGQICLKS